MSLKSNHLLFLMLFSTSSFSSGLYTRLDGSNGFNIIDKSGLLVKIQSCHDYISFQVSGNEIKEYEDDSNVDWQSEKAFLIKCNIQNFLTKNNFKHMKSFASDLKSLPDELPFFVKEALSDDEKRKLKDSPAMLTLRQVQPDIKIMTGSKNKLTSAADKSVYTIGSIDSFSKSGGEKVSFMEINYGVTDGGSLSYSRYFLIKDQLTTPWKLEEIEEKNIL